MAALLLSTKYILSRWCFRITTNRHTTHSTTLWFLWVGQHKLNQLHYHYYITYCLLLTPQLTVSHDHAPSSLWVDDINLLLHTQSSNQTPFFKSTLCLNKELFLGFIRLHWVQGGAWRWGSNQWIEQQGLRRPENWHRVVQEIRKVRLQVRR